MGIKDKMANAKTTDWLTRDISNFKLKRIRWFAYLFAIIEFGIKKILYKIK